ncbi:hypothetical protein KXD40_003274 [Peronospora effusa]|uniref:CWH43-like N-terminal domain-containing protein n=1 Tax=Peronospora effusa TaxID=542832 RepID=A0A3M6VG29_9STRA|nr:hypothetical protein DD238_004786 [Peronospora effusa]UIZ29354.1 hypothetical protein KXD40_003274 [Peronospora effusa]
MVWTDNVDLIAWLVPFLGIFTMLSTEVMACMNHFNCADNYPTLSYAATFQPEGYVFMGGMCLTAIFICGSDMLFFWYLRLLRNQKAPFEDISTNQVVMGYGCVMFGTISAISLIGLAVLDMRTYHDAHVSCTIVFFITAWMMILAVHTARKNVLHADGSKTIAGKVSTSESLWIILRRRSFWLALRRWRRLDCFTAYTLGRFLVHAGLVSTFLCKFIGAVSVGVFFLCANGVWPNPLGFTAVQEAFFEAFTIVCQLLFMGTLSCELAHLARLVERSDCMELERCE